MVQETCQNSKFPVPSKHVQKLTEILIKAKLTNKVLNGTSIKALIDTSDKSRYALINKAIKHGELIQLARSKYILNPEISGAKFSNFYLANQIHPLSYISLESSLAYHSWIPEAVRESISVIQGNRKKEYLNKFGVFSYTPISIDKEKFYACVAREQSDTQTYLIANPVRALLDLIYIKKIAWQGLDLLSKSYRIDLDKLKEANSIKDLKLLQNSYRSKLTNEFSQNLLKELEND